MLNCRKQVKRRAVARFLSALLVAWILELLAVVFFVSGLGDVTVLRWAALACHLLAGMPFLLVRKKVRALQGLGYYLPRLTGMLILALPMFGVIGVTLSVFGARVLLKPKGLAKDYEKSEYVTEGDLLPERLGGPPEVFLRQEVSIRPIVDIMAGTDRDARRAAVNLLRRLGTSDAVRILKDTISDADVEVRFYAHTALTRLEEKYADEIRDREERARRGAAEDYRALAFLYRRYADSGLPEEALRESYLLQAIMTAKKALEQEPQDMELILEVADVLLECEAVDEAKTMYAKALQDKESVMRAAVGILQCYYQSGDMRGFMRARKTLAKKAVAPAHSAEVRRMYRFWVSGRRQVNG